MAPAKTSQKSASLNTPSTSTAKKVASTTLQQKIPIKTNVQEFSSANSKGSFQTFTTRSENTLKEPPTTPTSPKGGDLFIHINTGAKPETRQVWLYRKNGWDDISLHWKEMKMVVHPIIEERVLTVRSDQSPNWILKSSAESMAKRKRALAKPSD